MKRRFFLILALAATLAAAGWVASQDHVDEKPEPRKADATTSPRAKPEPAAAKIETVTDLPLDMLKRPPSESGKGNPFPSRTWQPPPPPPPVAVKPAPPPPPVAPPLPYSIFGQMLEEGRATAFLNGRDRSYAVKVGDVLDRAYRVDSIKDNVVVFTYLPLNQQQILRGGVE